MATKNFTQFDLRTNLLTSDFVVGYQTDGPKEFRATVKDIINLVQDSDNQTLIFNEPSKLLSISSGNTVSLSSFANNEDFDSYKTQVASATATLLSTSIFQAASGNWQDTYTTVQANSALWEESADITAITTTVASNSSNWNEGYNIGTAYQAVSSTFLTSETDSQTLSFNENTKDLSISSGNTVSLSSFATNDSLQLLSPSPTYISPTAFLTDFSTTSLEVGSSVIQTLTLNWFQNDAGSFIPGSLLKNNALLTQINFLSALYGVNDTVSLETTMYTLSVNYNTGPVKNNILGFPDTRGQIQAGSVTDTSSYTGYYRRWIGSNSAFPTSPSSIRTLSLSTTLDTNNTLASQASPIYIDSKFILIAIPNTKSLATVITEANENLTSQFSVSSVQIPDAGSTLRDYKLYYLETAVPLNGNLINVTLA